jgi:hypothetical protein
VKTARMAKVLIIPIPSMEVKLASLPVIQDKGVSISPCLQETICISYDIMDIKFFAFFVIPETRLGNPTAKPFHVYLSITIMAPAFFKSAKMTR